MNELIGPPLGGLLVAISIPLALVGSAMGFALAALGLTLLAGSFKPVTDGSRQSMTHEIREGLGFLWSNRVLRVLALMVGGFNLADSAVFGVFVLYVVAPGPMGLDEVGFGLLITVFAVGGLLGSVLVERAERRLGRSNLLFASVLTSASVMLVPLLTHEVAPVAAGFFVLGVMVMMWNVITVSLRQRITPDHLLGRLNAAYRLFGFGVMPIGALVGGLLAEAFGVPAVFLFAVVVNVAMLAFRPLLTDARLAAAETPVSGAPAA